MTTNVIELIPQDLAELSRELKRRLPDAMPGILVYSVDRSRLRLDTPLRELVQYQFELNAQWFSWKTADSKVAVNLEHLSVEQRTIDSIFQVEFQSTSPSTPQMKELLGHAKSPVKKAFLTRALRALDNLNALDEATLLEATQASDDRSVLVAALCAAETLSSHHPLRNAQLRGIESKRKLLEDHGGDLSSAQAAVLLRVTRQAIDKRRNDGKLLAVELGKKGYRYPAWQFEIEGLEQVLRSLGSLDSWQKLSFFVNPNDLLEDKSPLDVLKTRSTSIEQVQRAAEAYGEHGG